MTSAVEHPLSLAAVHPNVDNLLTDRAGSDRIGPPPRAAAARTVHLRRRRRTFPEPPHQGRQSNRAVDNFALRELSSLALFQ